MTEGKQRARRRIKAARAEAGGIGEFGPLITLSPPLISVAADMTLSRLNHAPSDNCSDEAASLSSV
jgi:hypothetical protein